MAKANRLFLPKNISSLQIYQAWYLWGLHRYGRTYPLALLERIRTISPGFNPSRLGLYTVIDGMVTRGLLDDQWASVHPGRRHKRYISLTAKGEIEVGSTLRNLRKDLLGVPAAIDRVLEKRLASYNPEPSTVNGDDVWEFLILAELILDREISGYEVRKRILKLLGDERWHKPDSSLYTILGRLKDAGLIDDRRASESSKKTFLSLFIPQRAMERTVRRMNELGPKVKYLLLHEKSLIENSIEHWKVG